MNWSDERYVRLYTRDTTDWIILGWEAQAVFMLILRKVDRAGILDAGPKGEQGDWSALATLIRVPVDVADRSLKLLLDDGCLVVRGRNLLVRNFLEAQEASMSHNARQRESRMRRRDLVRSGLDPEQRETVIYFIQSENGGPIKIGRADDLAKRLVGLQVSRPDKLIVLAAAPGTVALERSLHSAFSDFREKGEWFSPTPALMRLVREVESHGAVALSRFVTGHTVGPTASQVVESSPGDGVTVCDTSQNECGHSVPYRAVPSLPKDPERLRAREVQKAGQAPSGSDPNEPPPASDPPPWLASGSSSPTQRDARRREQPAYPPRPGAYVPGTVPKPGCARCGRRDGMLTAYDGPSSLLCPTCLEARRAEEPRHTVAPRAAADAHAEYRARLKSAKPPEEAK